MLCEDVVKVSGIAVHGDFASGPFWPFGPVEGCELRPLIGGYEFRRAEAVDGPISALRQSRAPNACDIRLASTLRVNRSMVAARQRKPLRIGRQVMSARKT
ncbi:MAG: hypothetical protein ACK5UA_04320 [Cereibacter sp.]